MGADTMNSDTMNSDTMREDGVEKLSADRKVFNNYFHSMPF